jgi:hypothetical protein
LASTGVYQPREIDTRAYVCLVFLLLAQFAQAQAFVSFHDAICKFVHLADFFGGHARAHTNARES